MIFPTSFTPLEETKEVSSLDDAVSAATPTPSGATTEPRGRADPAAELEVKADEDEEADEEDEEDEDAAPSWMIHPDSPAKLTWELLLCVFLLWLTISVPFEIGFDVHVHDLNPSLHHLEIVIDILFAIDICFSLRTGTSHADGSVDMRPAHAARHYVFGGWFVLDFLTTIPWNFVLLLFHPSTEDAVDDEFAVNAEHALLGYDDGAAYGYYNASGATAAASGSGGDDNSDDPTSLSMLRVARVLKAGKILRVQKLMRGAALEAYENAMATSASARLTLKVIKLLLAMMFLFHWIACVWHFAAVSSPGDNNWIVNYFGLSGDDDGGGGVDVGGELTEIPLGKRYIASMYYTAETMTTVGYGDITPASDSERIVLFFLMILGGTFYGYLIGSMSAVVADSDAASNEYNDRMGRVASYMVQRNFPPDLAKRVKVYFRRLFAAQTAMDDSSVLDGLSASLRVEVAYFLVADVVRAHPAFVALPPSAFAGISNLVRPNFFTEGERIVARGEEISELMFVADGVALVMDGQDDEVLYNGGVFSATETSTAVLRVLEKGTSFGEEALLKHDLGEHLFWNVHVVAHSAQLECLAISVSDLYAKLSPADLSMMREAVAGMMLLSASVDKAAPTKATPSKNSNNSVLPLPPSDGRTVGGRGGDGDKPDGGSGLGAVAEDGGGADGMAAGMMLTKHEVAKGRFDRVKNIGGLFSAPDNSKKQKYLLHKTKSAAKLLKTIARTAAVTPVAADTDAEGGAHTDAEPGALPTITTAAERWRRSSRAAATAASGAGSGRAVTSVDLRTNSSLMWSTTLVTAQTHLDDCNAKAAVAGGGLRHRRKGAKPTTTCEQLGQRLDQFEQTVERVETRLAESDARAEAQHAQLLAALTQLLPPSGANAAPAHLTADDDETE